MKPGFAALSFILFVLFCGVAGWISYEIWQLTQFVIEGARQLEPSVYVPLATTIAAASLGLVATLWTQTVTRRREIEAAHRERKVEIYLQLMQLIQKLLLQAKPELGSEKLDTNQLALELLTIRTKAVVWGSPSVLRPLAKLTQSGLSTAEIFTTLEELQRAMRRDLGLSNFGLENGFFAKLPLANPKEYDEFIRKSE